MMRLSLKAVMCVVAAIAVCVVLRCREVDGVVSEEGGVKIVEEEGTVSISWPGNEGVACQISFGQTNGSPSVESVSIDLDGDGAIGEKERLKTNSAIAYRAVIEGNELEARFDSTRWKVTREPWGIKVLLEKVKLDPLEGFLEYRILPGSSMVPCVLWLKARTRCALTEIEHRLDFASTERIGKILARHEEEVFSLTNEAERPMSEKPISSAIHDKCVVAEGQAGVALGLTMPPHNWFQGYPSAVDGPGTSGSIGLVLYTDAWRKKTFAQFYGGDTKRFITLYYIGRQGEATFKRLRKFFNNTFYAPLPGYKIFSTNNHHLNPLAIKKLDRMRVNFALWTNSGFELTPERWQEQISSLSKLNTRRFKIIPSAITTDAAGPEGKLRGKLNMPMSYITPLPVLIRGAKRDETGKNVGVSGEEGAERRARIAVEADGLAWIIRPTQQGLKNLVENWTDDLFALEWNTYSDIHILNKHNRFKPGFERLFFDRYEALLNAGRKIYIISGTSDNTMSYIYLQGVANYVRMEGMEIEDLIKALREGDFFITTGEILIKDAHLNGVRPGGELKIAGGEAKARIALSLKWTYPLREIRVISNKGQEVTHRPSQHREFGEGDFQFPVELKDRTWVRVEVWDVANNLAFSQPVFISGGEPGGAKRSIQSQTMAAETPAPEPAGWKLAFSDNFERPLLGSDWEALSGEWSIDKGRLMGKGQILCAWRLPGPQRLEYDARSRDISPVGDHQVCDLSAMLLTGSTGLSGGFFFGFGSDNNTRSKLWVKGKEIASYDQTITLFKTYHVVCEFDGKRLRHIIDGKVVHTQEVDEKLTGLGHEQVGFYLWLPGLIDNVRVYTKSGDGTPPQKRSIELVAPPEPALIKNGSFEKLHPIARPRVPTNWIAEGWTRDDRVELVTEAEEAHRGQRFVRLSAPGEHGIRMHSFQRGMKKLKPGTTYTIRLWARRPSSSTATLYIQPGDYETELGEDWKLHEVRYAHPSDAKPELGMFFEIKGGPADVDDVSMTPEGESEPVPVELASDWTKLKKLRRDDRWHQKPKEPAYKERIPIVVRETAGKPAKQHAVSVPLKSIFRAYNYDFVSTKKMQVTDSAARGAPAVPWGLVATHPKYRTDPYHAGADDLLIFLVDIPALSEKTYYVYLEDRKHARPFTISDRIPKAVNVASIYPHRLSVEVGDVRHALSASAGMDGDILRAEIHGWTATPARAQVVSPDGKQTIKLPLKSSGKHGWQVNPGWRFPEDAPEGVWKLSVTFGNRSGVAGKRGAPFLYGNAMWWDSNTRRIFPDDPPRYRRTTARIAAARNEWEAFQVAVATNRGLKQVKLRPTDLTHTNRKAKIDANRITVEAVEHSFLFRNAGLRSGLTPAPLLPWWEKDISAGTQAVAWVTVRVPEGVPSGRYTGAILAESSNGWRGELPVNLEVFDFSLPKVFTFTPLIGGSLKRSILRESMPDDWEEKLASDKHFSYAKANRFSVQTSFRELILDWYRYFGERHITPTVAGLITNLGRTYTAATYHPSQKTVEIDFWGIDAIIDLIEKEQLDVKFLVHTGLGQVKGYPKRPPGWIALNNSETGVTTYGFHGTPEGYELLRLWLTGLRDGLRPKGWSGRTIFYTNDESFGVKTKYGTVSELVTVYNRIIHEVAPEFRTFCADNAGKGWSEGLDGTDFFTGAMNEVNLKRFRELGNTWWGIYNRPLSMNVPLGNARIVGLDCWLRGWKYQWHYHSTYWNQSFWFNPSPLYYYPANAGYPDKFFVKSEYMVGFYMMYPWPSRRGPAWKPGERGFAGSTHVEAIRESAEDYEYITMLETLADRARDGSRQQRECRELLDKVRSFIKRANQGTDYRWGGSHSVFVVNGDKLQALRRTMGRTIAAWRKKK